MRGVLAATLLALLVAGGPVAPAEEPTPGIAWFETLRAARALAVERGRPVWIAMHPGTEGRELAWPYGGPGWNAVYRDPAIVKLSRRFVCFQRVVGAAPQPVGLEHDARPEPANAFQGPEHLVLDASGTQLLARVRGWDFEPGPMSVRALTAFLEGAWSRAPTREKAGPEVGPADRRKAEPAAAGRTVGASLSLPPDASGFRMHLRWPVPLPRVGAAQVIAARPSIYWNGAGPFDLPVVRLEVGTEIDVPVDVRYADQPKLKPLATPGRHRVDVYLRPVDGGVPFSTGPLHVGLIWIQLGNGGGGGGAGHAQRPEAAPDEQDGAGDDPTPEPSEPPEPIEPPPPGDDHVVEPLIREGETVKKDDAIVGVKADDAAIEPPPPAPQQTPPRDFKKQLEESIHWERIPLAERAFLRRYFDALDKALRDAAKREPPK